MRCTVPSLRRPSARRRGGFTLIEITISTFILGLMLVSIMGIYTAMMRLSASVAASSFVSLDAANAVQRVANNLREAQAFELMDGPSSVDGTNFGTAYDATDGSGNTIVTGIRLFSPGAYTATGAPPNGYPAGTVGVTVSGSSYVAALTGTSAPWDHNKQGATLDIYRSDKLGNPQPSSGAYLWLKGTEAGQAINRAIVKTIAPQVNAVQFFQPHTNPADQASPLIGNEVQIKIVCAKFDLTHGGSTSSDSASGAVSALSGDCTYMRDHTPLSAGDSGSNGHAQH